MHLIAYYFSALIPMLILDMVWIQVIAKEFYADKLGFLFAKSFNIVPAMVFYPMYAFVLLLLAVMPALTAASWTEALWRGALLGLAAYGAYDLTNHATIANWPTIVTVVDIAWGVFVTATTSVVAYFIITSFK